MLEAIKNWKIHFLALILVIIAEWIGYAEKNGVANFSSFIYRFHRNLYWFYDNSPVNFKTDRRNLNYNF